ncbi:MAG: tRNA (adenosine(37)-N6)-threonylcarbamoyltransferase complex dimerization subunit type 1 TsaB [Porcipelethomonas sp.]
MLILGIDTSGKTAAAALYEDGIMLGQSSVYTVKTQSQVILPMVKKLMSDCGRELSRLTLIAVSAGPGSYTGIRIGIAAVKAMAFALEIPCCAVSTLEGLAYGCGHRGYVCPVMKARKDLVYASVYDMSGGQARPVLEQQVISVTELDEFLKKIDGNVVITGDAGEDFLSEHRNPKYSLSPVHLRLQSGSGIILAAMNKKPQTDDEIQASYLQMVKAEKDLINAAHG